MNEKKLFIYIPSINKEVYVGIKDTSTFGVLKKYLCESYNMEYDNTVLICKNNNIADDCQISATTYTILDKIILNYKNTTNDDKSIPLNLVFTNSESVVVNVYKRNKWSDVKQILQENLHIPAVSLSLFYKNCQLQDDTTVLNSDILAASQIFIARRHDDSILNEIITDRFRFTCKFCHKVGAAIRFRYSCSVCGDEGVVVKNGIVLGQSHFSDLRSIKCVCGIKSCPNYNKESICDLLLYCKDCPPEYRLNSNRMFIIHGGCESSDLILKLNEILGYDYKFYFENCNSLNNA